jgi:mono/diheme cytochrome c family protein
MSRAAVGLLVCLLCIVLSLAACGGGGTATTTISMDRPTPPAEYAGKSNPFGIDEAAVQAGQAIYQRNCTTCHGETGMGDGPVAASLNPKPQPLAANQEQLEDNYLFWRIREGGLRAPFSSVMPSWKSILSEQEIWQVISYLRTMAE